MVRISWSNSRHDSGDPCATRAAWRRCKGVSRAAQAVEGQEVSNSHDTSGIEQSLFEGVSLRQLADAGPSASSQAVRQSLSLSRLIPNCYQG
jgi:hypothetical protein